MRFGDTRAISGIGLVAVGDKLLLDVPGRPTDGAMRLSVTGVPVAWVKCTAVGFSLIVSLLAAWPRGPDSLASPGHLEAFQVLSRLLEPIASAIS
jgi:hypothetical protein